MITTRRADNNSISAFGSEASRGGVALLERKEPVTYKEYIAPETANESVEEARQRMQDNLAKLLNYDRYSEQVQDSAVTVEQTKTEEVVETVASAVEEISAFSEDDIRPTSTTMQFGDGDIENLRMDMKQEEEQQSIGKYRLNAKGKVVVILYALVLTVVMALIAINTGVLARLSNNEQTIKAEASSKMQTLSAIQAEMQTVSSPEYIMDVAETELGMIKG